MDAPTQRLEAETCRNHTLIGEPRGTFGGKPWVFNLFSPCFTSNVGLSSASNEHRQMNGWCYHGIDPPNDHAITGT